MATEDDVFNEFVTLTSLVNTKRPGEWKESIGSQIKSWINEAVEVYNTTIINSNISGNASIEASKILASGTFASFLPSGNEFIFDESGISINKQLNIRGLGGQIVMRSSLGSIYNLYIDESGTLITQESTSGTS